LAAERAEHVLLFNLLGDPLLRLHHPGVIQLDVPRSVVAGTKLAVAGTAPLDGTCLVELVCRRDRLTFSAPVRHQFDRSHQGLAALNDDYRRANDPRWTKTILPIAGGQFRTVLDVPSAARGPGHVRVYAEGESDFAIGSADVYVRASREDEQTAHEPEHASTPGSQLKNERGESLP
jgi:hypothetical protein